MFKVDYSEVKEQNGIIAEGFYETVIVKAEINISKSGKQFIDMWCTVRNDIEQNYKNVNIFNKLWKSKDTDEYQMWQIQAISKSAQLENGKNYSSIEEWLKDLYNKTIKLKIVHEEYNGEPQPKVKGYYESEYPKLNHKFSKKELEKNNSLIELSINDDDIPF